MGIPDSMSSAAGALRLLILEDDPSDAGLILHELRQAGHELIWQRVDDEETYLRHLDPAPDLILADYRLPQFDALRALSLLQERGLDVPFIVVSGKIGEETAVQCLKRGAADYLMKDRLPRLGMAVEHALNEKRLRDEKRRAEDELRLSEERYRTLVESVDDAIVVKDAQGRYVLMNSAAESSYGARKADVLGKTAAEVLPAGLALRHMQDDEHVLTTAARVEREVEHQTPAGPRIEQMRKVPQCDATGKVIGIVAIGRDITAHKRALEELRRSEERFRSVAQTANDAILIVHGSGKIVFWNRAAATIYGFSSDEIIGQRFALIVPKRLRRQQLRLFHRALSVGPSGVSVRPLEGTGLRKDGSEFPVEASFAMWQAGDEAFLSVIARDIAERKEGEARLKQGLETLQVTLESTIRAMASMVETRDPYTAGHQHRVADLARALAAEMGLSEEQVHATYLAALVHDIGKIYVPADILSKPGQLNRYEFGLIQAHPQVAHDILRTIDFPWPIAEIAIQHHERMNGSGYPLGLKGEETRLEARILGVADVVEAMSSHRPYRPALGTDKALEELAEQSGTLYDPRVVQACVALFGERGFSWETVA